MNVKTYYVDAVTGQEYRNLNKKNLVYENYIIVKKTKHVIFNEIIWTFYVEKSTQCKIEFGDYQQRGTLPGTPTDSGNTPEYNYLTDGQRFDSW